MRWAPNGERNLTDFEQRPLLRRVPGVGTAHEIGREISAIFE
jgi:hypothetical protein